MWASHGKLTVERIAELVHQRVPYATVTSACLTIVMNMALWQCNGAIEAQ